MSRILTSILTIALLASCAKTEVQYEPAGEIGFAPVSKISTKAAVPGTVYPTDLPMYVFANAGLPSAAYPDGYTEPYFVKAKFIHRSGTEKTFGGDPAYYWPNVKKLIFSGVSESGNISPTLNPPSRFVYEANEYTVNQQTVKKYEIEIDGYRPTDGSAQEGDNDLMWFSTTQAYDKRAEAINVEMKHACAWVTIKIKGDAITGSATDPWKLTEVKFANLALEGNVILGERAQWTLVEEMIKPKTLIDQHTHSEGIPLTEEYNNITQINGVINDLIVIPQQTRTLTIEYKFVSQKGGGPGGTDLVITESKEIPLTYTGDQGWKAGTHYTYNITIGTKEILVDPTVSEWDPEILTNVQI